MPHLYELPEKLEALLEDVVDKDTGEITPEAQAQLDRITDQAEDVACDIAAYMKNLEAERGAVETEMKKLQIRERSLKRRIDWLKEYLATHLASMGLEGKKLQDGRVRITWNKTSSIEIYDPVALPGYLYNEPKPVAPTPDKRRIKELIDDGQTVPGARVNTKKYVVVK